jgi:hypothetical protein
VPSQVQVLTVKLRVAFTMVVVSSLHLVGMAGTDQGVWAGPFLKVKG